MSKLNKTKSGLLFYDDFSERTLLWQLSPSDAECLRFGENGLRILHGRRYVTFTLPEPDIEEYSCVVEIDHQPVNFDDIAGVIVLSNNKEYAECQTFLATGPSEIGNSDEFSEDLKQMIREQINASSNIVFWDENDEAPNEDEANTESPEIPEDFKDTIYRYIKFTKQKHKYMFWASEDSKKWIEVGTVKFDNSGVIGFFLYGTTDDEILDNSHCYIRSAAIYDGRYIIIDGISRKYEFELYDKENGRIYMRTDDIGFYDIMNRSNTRTIINTVNMPMPIKNCTLRIFPHDNYEGTVEQFELDEDMYGGDAFYMEHDIKFFIGQRQVLTEELYDLGTFFRGSYFIKASVMNCEDYTMHGIKIQVTAYSEYYGGEQEVYLALANDDLLESELDYKKELTVDLQASECKNICIRLLEQPEQGFYMAANDYRFKIMIE